MLLGVLHNFTGMENRTKTHYTSLETHKYTCAQICADTQTYTQMATLLQPGAVPQPRCFQLCLSGLLFQSPGFPSPVGLPRPPLTSHTQTRGAVILRRDSGFGQEACVQQDGRGLARPQDMPIIPPSPRATRREHPLLQALGHVLPAAPREQHPRPPCSHSQQRLSLFHLCSQAGFSGPKPLKSGTGF